MIKKLVYTVALLMLSGCAGIESIPIDMASVNATKPQTITKLISINTDFYADTARKRIQSIFSATNTSIPDGNKIVQENNIEDPVLYISKELTKALSDKLDLEIINDNADLLLVVETSFWGFTYFKLDWNFDEYRVLYEATLRLMDLRTGAIIAQGFCLFEKDRDEYSPSYDEMLSENALRLKQELKLAAEYCIGEFKSNALKI